MSPCHLTRYVRHAKARQAVSALFSRSLSVSTTKSYENPGYYHGRQAEKKNDVKDRAADRELLLNVLNASTTRRDAKSYLSRFTSKGQPAETPASRALHLALVTIRSPQDIDQNVVEGIGHTLSQLARLGLLSVLVLDTSNADTRSTASQQCDRLVSALQAKADIKARRLDYALALSSSSETLTTPSTPSIPTPGLVKVHLGDILYKTLQQGIIPVIPPIAYSADDQHVVAVDADEALVALGRYFVSLNVDTQELGSTAHAATNDSSDSDAAQGRAEIDRLIILDSIGGLPSKWRADKAHIFVNLEQEYNHIRTELSTLNVGPDRTQHHDFSSRLTDDTTRAASHTRNLNLAQKVLSLLPPTSSALITTPAEAATLPPSTTSSATDLGVATRRPKNPLIFNLLTDKPTISSSLPVARLRPATSASSQTTQTNTVPHTFLKRGMPVTMIPDPRFEPWVPPSTTNSQTATTLQLDDPRVDFPRLLDLIEKSFGRKLDVEDYIARIKHNLAGLIIAGSYEGAALLTWEGENKHIPYLDKFAVHPSSQGTGGVADILFSAMVRTCLPNGVVWRSRKNNPVNKWYFERSSGCWRLPGAEWNMFWTGDSRGVLEEDGGRKLREYASVCRGVKASWADDRPPE